MPAVVAKAKAVWGKNQKSDGPVVAGPSDG